MNKAQLINVIDQGISGLTLNKESVPLEALQELTTALEKLTDPSVSMLLKPFLGDSLDKALKVMQKIVEIETKLLVVQPGQKVSSTDALIAGLSNLKRRPLILGMIAHAL